MHAPRYRGKYRGITAQSCKFFGYCFAPYKYNRSQVIIAIYIIAVAAIKFWSVRLDNS